MQGLILERGFAKDVLIGAIPFTTITTHLTDVYNQLADKLKPEDKAVLQDVLLQKRIELEKGVQPTLSPAGIEEVQPEEEHLLPLVVDTVRRIFDIQRRIDRPSQAVEVRTQVRDKTQWAQDFFSWMQTDMERPSAFGVSRDVLRRIKESAAQILRSYLPRLSIPRLSDLEELYDYDIPDVVKFVHNQSSVFFKVGDLPDNETVSKRHEKASGPRLSSIFKPSDRRSHRRTSALDGKARDALNFLFTCEANKETFAALGWTDVSEPVELTKQAFVNALQNLLGMARTKAGRADLARHHELIVYLSDVVNGYDLPPARHWLKALDAIKKASGQLFDQFTVNSIVESTQLPTDLVEYVLSCWQHSVNSASNEDGTRPSFEVTNAGERLPVPADCRWSKLLAKFEKIERARRSRRLEGRVLVEDVAMKALQGQLPLRLSQQDNSLAQTVDPLPQDLYTVDDAGEIVPASQGMINAMHYIIARKAKELFPLAGRAAA